MHNKMAINIYLSTTETKNQISEQAEHRYRGHYDCCQMGGVLGE